MNYDNTINKVFLLGEITRLPRRRTNGDDMETLSFTLTTRETIKQNGKPVSQAEDHAIKLAANKLETDLRLGQTVHLEGKLKTTTFVDAQSVKRYKTEVIGIRLTIIT